MLVSALLLAIQVDSSAYLRTHREADRALVAGRAAEARAAFERCLELSPQNPTAAYGLACAHARAGEKDAALRALAQAVEWGYAEADLASWDEDLAEVRGEESVGIAIDAMRDRGRAPTEFPRVQVVDYRERNDPAVIALDPSASRVAVGHRGGEVTFLDARSGVDLPPMHDFRTPVCGLDVRPDGKTLAVFTSGGGLHFWEPASVKEPRSVFALWPKGENGGIPSCSFLAFDATGERVLAVGTDRGAVLCTSTGEVVRKFEGEFEDSCPPKVAWNPDGSFFASWSDVTVTFHDGKTGVPTGEVLLAPPALIGLAYSPDGRTIATGHHEGIVRLWQATTGANAFALSSELGSPENPPDVWFLTPPQARQLAFSPDGRHLAVSYGKSTYVSIIDVEARTISWTSEFQGGRMGEHVLLRWSAEGRRLWWAWGSGDLCHVDLDANYAVTELPGGRLPAIRGDKAVFTDRLAVTALDSSTGQFLWARATLGRAGVMFLTPSGYFDCDFDDLSELVLDRLPQSRQGTAGFSAWLAELAPTLFDPKRVRAAKAGVALAPIAW